MSFLRKVRIKNGDHFEPFYIYQCDKCHCEVPENWPRDDDEPGKDYCFDCSFKMGRIDWKTWIDAGTGFNSFMFKAAIDPETGEIEIAMIKQKFSWQRPQKEYRHTIAYQQWRKSVFERDSYTCQSCKVIGGELQAHHIKTYNKHKLLRFELSNGITLCKKCHRDLHKKAVKQ